MELAPPPPRPFHGPAGADAGGGAGGGPGRGGGPRGVHFSLTGEEFEDVSRAAERSGLARGALAAEAALASARGARARAWWSLREALAEGIAAAGLVRRAG